MSKVRVRFAPSPTGYVHVGNARTALFNWLFARHHGGAFVLRIEDTDVERSKEEYEHQLLADLRWFGLDWDEGPDNPGPFGPYRQSERKESYRQYASQLIDAGHAYFCFCSAEQLEAEREAALKASQQPRYSGRCRTRPREEAARKVAAGEPAAIRLKMSSESVPLLEFGTKPTDAEPSPNEDQISWHDAVHGVLGFPADVFGDPILVRSNHLPAYNFAVVIDDHLMEISHVIRGDDHISNTPRQLALYQALGWDPPQFAHLSTILGPDRARLSKRHGATSLKEFADRGILPEALRNYLALLGWSPGDGVTEIMSEDDLIAKFSLSHVTKSPAVFDIQKLNWMNAQYVFKLSDDAKGEHFRKLIGGVLTLNGYLQPEEAESARDLIYLMIEIIADRTRPTDLMRAIRIIFEYDAASVVSGEETRHVLEDAAAREVLKAFVPKMLALDEVTYERFREVTKTVQKETGKKGKDLFHPIRVALTGAVSGPELEKLVPIFEEGSKLPLARHVKSCAERLREFEKLL